MQEIRPIVRALLKWYRANARDLPWRRTTRPYPIWVSEIMLQQTQVATVIPYWKRWMKALPSTKALAEAPEEQVLKLWEGLGYYRRARNLQKSAQRIVNELGGRFPKTHEEVLRLPGVGPYTAGAICSIAFNHPAPIVDGNAIRVLTRVFGITGDPKEKATDARLWSLARELVNKAVAIQGADERNCSDFNQSLMELGATVCTPANPACSTCPIAKRCVANKEGRQAELPRLKKAQAATPRTFRAYAIKRGNRFLVRQRRADLVNPDLWEFPNFEPATENPPILPTVGEFTPLYTIKHSITRFRITLEAFIGQARPRYRPTVEEVWLTTAELEKLAFTSAHRKILNKLIALE
ncbi:MAG: A/G-specific adenine glycosylase [Candidatus Binatia bacterium]